MPTLNKRKDEEINYEEYNIEHALPGVMPGAGEATAINTPNRAVSNNLQLENQPFPCSNAVLSLASLEQLQSGNN